MAQPQPWWRAFGTNAGPCAVLQGIEARSFDAGDLDFLQALYASTREQEMACIGWPPSQCEQFLRQQFEFQHSYYQEHFADADFLVLLRAGRPIGRLYWRDGGDGTASLIDLSLVPAERGRGIGTALMAMLAAHADRRGLHTVLHVEPFNRAHELYRRFGFDVVDDNGIYLKMMRRAHATVSREAHAA